MKDLEPIAIGVLIGSAWSHHNIPILIAGAVVGVAWVIACARSS